MDRTFCIAPMMGRTDTHFRNLCRFASKHAVLFTEMVHSNALLKNKRIDKYIQRTDIENPVVFQLGGCEPRDLAEATKIINENNGKNETKTSFIITAVGGISSAAGLGAIDGFNQALKTA